MSDTLQLIHEAIEITDAAPPALLEDDSPVLADDVVVAPAGELYLVGLIGGKDVGKSALVNALVGRRITPPSSHGAGTETAIAYCHESQQAAVRELLEKQVPGRYSIVPHNVTRLTHQVLLDLPDIDSHF